MKDWQPIETAPLSTPMEQRWFLAFCPNDPWGAFGNIHVACRYERSDSGTVRVQGSNGDRPATHWTPAPEPPHGSPA